jgi:hypothetical protein
MPSILSDPLYQAQSKTAQDLLGLYSPEQEEQRYGKAKGQLLDTLAGRAAKSGLTGSSEERDELANAARDFELGWAERKPAQLAQAVTASHLPVRNLLEGGLGERRLNMLEDQQDYAKLLGLADGGASLLRWLGWGSPQTGATVGNWITRAIGSGVGSLWNWLTDSGYDYSDLFDSGGGLTQAAADLYDPAIDWDAPDFWSW